MQAYYFVPLKEGSLVAPKFVILILYMLPCLSYQKQIQDDMYYIVQDKYIYYIYALHSRYMYRYMQYYIFSYCSGEKS